MTDRTLKRLLGLLAVAVLVWLGVSFFSGRRGKPAGSGAVTAFFDGLNPTDVQAVHIVGPKDTIVLRQQSGAWTVNGAPTDSARLARLWSELKSADVRDLVASNPDNYARLGVAADSTWKLTFDLGGGSRTLYVGGAGPTYTTAYVRLPDADGVYTLDGGLRLSVVSTLDDWRNKKVVAVDSAAVDQVDVDRDGHRYQLVRRDSTWSLKGGGAVDTAVVRNVLSELSDLRATGFYHPGDSLAARGGSVVALNGMGDTLAALTVGAGEGNRWMRSRGDSTLYKVAAYRVDRVMPTPSTLKKGG